MDSWNSLSDLFHKTTFLNNELWRYAMLLLGILAGLVVGRIVRCLMERASRRLQKGDRKTLAGVVLECLSRPASLFCFAVGFRTGILVLKTGPGAARAVETCMDVLFAVVVAWAIYRLVDVADYYLRRWAEGTDSKIDDMLVPMLRKSLRITVVIIAAMFIIESVYGKDIKTLLAGLGVGGLAVALAAQDSIKNLFGSLMILLDKPFQVGERITFNEHDGPVEEVGFRSTKIRTLDGHLVSVPNSLIANEAVKNIGRRPYIRRLTNITIPYDTPPEKVRRALAIVRDVLEDHEGMAPEFPPRVFFNEFNSASLNLLTIYWYHPPDYWRFLAFSEKVNLEILDRFNAEGIDFAFPTQTVHLANDEKRQLALRLLRDETQRSS